MSKKLTPKIILEGTRLTSKTEIAFALNEHPHITGARKYRYHNPVISAEWCAFSNYPWGHGPINFEPQQEALAMETFSTWARLFELNRYYSWIIDRFHLSARAYQLQAHGVDYPFRWLEQRLQPLNFRMVLLTRTPDSFEAAREDRLKVSGNPSQYDDLSIFIGEQSLMRKLAAESILPLLELDISVLTVEQAADRIADWMEATGGLTMEE